MSNVITRLWRRMFPDRSEPSIVGNPDGLRQADEVLRAAGGVKADGPWFCIDPGMDRSRPLADLRIDEASRQRERQVDAIYAANIAGASSHHRHASERAEDRATDTRTAELMKECEAAESDEPIFEIVGYPDRDIENPPRWCIWEDGRTDFKGEFPRNSYVVNRIGMRLSQAYACGIEAGIKRAQFPHPVPRPRVRVTHTYAELELSPAAYDEIATRLREAGYDHAFMDSGAIDMHGIAVTLGEEPATVCTRPPEGWACSRQPGHDGPCAARRAYQQRVVDERLALDEKVAKLNAFFASDKFMALPDAEKGRLRRQFFAMVEYSTALFERIMAFETAPPASPDAGDALQYATGPLVNRTVAEALKHAGEHALDEPLDRRCKPLKFSDGLGNTAFSSPKVPVGDGRGD